MFKLNENYEVDCNILKCDYIRYSPTEKSTINTPNSQIYINIPRRDSVICLLNFYLGLKFEVIKKSDNSRCANGYDMRLLNLGSVALFSVFKLTTRSEKHLEDISHAHIVSLMYKLIRSSRGSDDFSIVFHRDCGRRREELTNNENTESKFHVRFILKDVFGFSEHQD